MSERLYDKYTALRDFVNRGKLPKTKEETLAIADVFHNQQEHSDVKKARKHAAEIELLTAESHAWKKRREALRSQRELCREVLRRLIEPNLTKIKKKDLKRLQKQ